MPRFTDLAVHAWWDRKTASGQLSVHAKPYVQGSTETMTLKTPVSVRQNQTDWIMQDDTLPTEGVFYAHMSFTLDVKEHTKWVHIQALDGPCKYVVIEYGGAIVALVPVEFV